MVSNKGKGTGKVVPMFFIEHHAQSKKSTGTTLPLLLFSSELFVFSYLKKLQD
jgi:hypothetical protein